MQFHSYHLVEPSPWPFVGAIGSFFITVGAVVFFHYGFSFFLYLGLLGVVGVMFV